MCTASPAAYQSGRRPATSRPNSSTSSWDERKTRLSSGCWAAQTPAATAPASAPRTVRVASIGIAATVTTVTLGSTVTTASHHAHLHRRARERGVNPLVYWIVPGFPQTLFHAYFQ